MTTAARQVAGGVAYTILANYSVRFVNLAITIIVARHVGTVGMGIVAAALLTVEIIDTIRDFGLREALIYKPDLDEEYGSSAFAVIQAVSLVQALAMATVALLGTHLGMDPAVAHVMIWLALLFPLSALGSPQEAMLQRAGAFGRRALADLVGVGIKALVVVALVTAGWGIPALVAAMLLGVGARSLTLWLMSGWRPRLQLPKLEPALKLIRYGKHIIAVNITALFRQKADQFVVAAMLGPSQLGVYFLAARIPEMAIFGVNVAISTVAFPTFSRIVHNGGDLPAAYLRTVRTSLLLMAPVAIGIAAVSDQLVTVLFGAQWLAAVPVLAILALGGIPLTMGWSAGDVFKATGQPELLSTISVIEVVVATPIVAAVVVATGELNWIAATMVACEAASCGLRLAFMARFADTAILRTLRAVAPILASAAVMGGVIHFGSPFIAPVPPVLRLVLSILLGVAVYAAMIMVTSRSSIIEIWQVLRPRADADPAGTTTTQRQAETP